MAWLNPDDEDEDRSFLDGFPNSIFRVIVVVGLLSGIGVGFTLGAIVLSIVFAIIEKLSDNR